jgi:hypothetical protein
MKKTYQLKIEIETEINDELIATRCRQDDVEKVKEFYTKLIDDDTAIFEYFKNWCLFYLFHMDMDALVELFDIKLDDKPIAGSAAHCSPKTADFINTVLAQGGKVNIDIDRLDSILNLIDSQFKIVKVANGTFDEITPRQVNKK